MLADSGDTMDRRHFLYAATAVPAVVVAGVEGKTSGSSRPMDVRQFHATRRFARLRQGRVAYVERGHGPAALFLHGLPLNGYQWRGALDRLSPYRRCIAPDFLGVGYSETPQGAEQTPVAQGAMLSALLDYLGVKTADIVGSDSGGAVAQLFAAHYPERVRTLLLTNCDAGADCPPQVLLPLIADAHAGTAAETSIVSMLNDHAKARETLGAAYTNPNTLTADLLEVYLRPFVQSPLRKQQFNQFLIALEQNVLQPVEPDLRRFQSPVRIVWGTGDTLFKPDSPDYLHRLFPRSRGVRRIEGAKLFWPEEFPEILAEEARKLWGV
jgi:pimeloyl-ACP methyl ester carboxylesterase